MRRQIDSLYCCPLCKKKVWLSGRAHRFKSYCDEYDKNAWMTLAKDVVHIRITIRTDLYKFLEERAGRLGIGMNECLDQVLRIAMDVEKKAKSAEK